MRAVVQRVLQSGVSVDGRQVGAIGRGFNILLGVMDGDTEAEATLLAGKIARLRVFEDAAGKMNLSMTEVGGAALVISQFTLCANLKKGNRPSFVFSAPPEEADRLYRFFCDELRANGVTQVETGEFGADMRVEIVNDGPVTIVMDTEIWKNSGK